MAGWTRTIAAAAFAATIAAAVVAPVSAQTSDQPPQSEADRLRCLWVGLPTVAQARLELAVRIGENASITVINQLGPGGLALLLAECGRAETVESVQLARSYWLARAAYEVARVRLRLADLDAAAVDAALDAATPAGAQAELGVEVMLRVRGRVGAVILAALEDRDAAREAAERDPMTQTQRRLVVEYGAARLILLGLEAGARPYELIPTAPEEAQPPVED